MQRKCCICIQLRTGIISIGVFTAIEALFYLSLVVSREFSTMQAVTFTFKAALCLLFILAFAKPSEILPRTWLYVTWIIDFCVTTLMVCLVFRTLGETGLYKDYCLQSREESPPGFWEKGPNGEDPFFTDVEQCEDFIKAANRTGLTLFVIIYTPIRLWLAWNLRDWLVELRTYKLEQQRQLREANPYQYNAPGVQAYSAD